MPAPSDLSNPPRLRSCNQCNVRRIKCSGDMAVSPVQQARQGLRISGSGGKGDDPQVRARAIERDAPRSRSSCRRLVRRKSRIRIRLRPAAEEAGFGTSPSSTLKAESLSTQQDEEELPPTQGRLLRDEEGTARYLGDTSGATFLDALKSFMTTMVPLAFKDNTPAVGLAASGFLGTVGQYLSPDSRPLELPAVEPTWLPPPAEMERMFLTLGYYIEDGHGAFPSGEYVSGDGWLPTPDPRAALSNADSAAPATNANQRHLAFYQIALACATIVNRTSMNPGQDGPVGEAYMPERGCCSGTCSTQRLGP